MNLLLRGMGYIMGYIMEMVNLTERDHSLLVEELMYRLIKVQQSGDKNFKQFVSNQYESKIYHYFPYLLTPTYQGALVKISDVYFENDTQYVDNLQEIKVDTQEEQLLWNAAANRILPFDVTDAQQSDEQLHITLESTTVPNFKLLNKSFSIWFLPSMDNIVEMVGCFMEIQKYPTSVLTITTEDDRKFSMPVNLSFGENFVIHSNQRFRQLLADPRLNFSIKVELRTRIKQKIKSMKLGLNCQSNISINHYELKRLFATNIFTFINQKHTRTDKVKIDGMHDVYWLSIDNDPDIQINTVKALFVNGEKLDKNNYKLIVSGKKIGIEFNSLSKVLYQSVYADVYATFPVNQSLYQASKSSFRINWNNQNASAYHLSVYDRIKFPEGMLPINRIDRFVLILNIKFAHNWGKQSWKMALKFLDFFALQPIAPLLRQVERGENNLVTFYFEDIKRNYQYWICYYLELLESFINAHSVSNIKLKGVFK